MLTKRRRGPSDSSGAFAPAVDTDLLDEASERAGSQTSSANRSFGDALSGNTTVDVLGGLDFEPSIVNGNATQNANERGGRGSLALRLRKDKSGSVATEYAFLIAFIAIVAASGMVMLGENLSAFYNGIGVAPENAGDNIPVLGDGGGDDGGSGGDGGDDDDDDD